MTTNTVSAPARKTGTRRRPRSSAAATAPTRKVTTPPPPAADATHRSQMVGWAELMLDLTALRNRIDDAYEEGVLDDTFGRGVSHTMGEVVNEMINALPERAG